jgi:periplasmic divalent cation tolerance protein
MLGNLILVFVTVPNIDLAKAISKELIENKLVACVNIFPKITSIYQWEGKLCEEEELLLICKSISPNFDEISKKVKEIHPYDIPEIISVPLDNCENNYKKWLLESTNSNFRQ